MGRSDNRLSRKMRQRKSWRRKKLARRRNIDAATGNKDTAKDIKVSKAQAKAGATAQTARRGY